MQFTGAAWQMYRDKRTAALQRSERRKSAIRNYRRKSSTAVQDALAWHHAVP